jgi:putative glutamine amidotransferase
MYDRLDGIFLAGGEDIDPSNYNQSPHALLGQTDVERDRVEILFARWALDGGKPILGVCRGHQMLSVALGGTMYQDVQTMLSGSEQHDYRDSTRYSRDLLSQKVTLAPTSFLAQIIEAQVAVNSLHHQAIDRLGQGLYVVGTTADGVIEAIELEHHPFALGVQWHPEELVADANMLGLFQAFVRASCAQPAVTFQGNGHYLGHQN